MKFDERRVGESARVGRVVVGSIVVHRPVHKLEIGIGAVGIQVEEIGKAEFSKPDFQPAFGQFAKQREWCSFNGDFLLPQRNDLMPHQARDVRRLAQLWIAHHVQVEESRHTQCFAEAMPAGFL